MHEPHTLHQRPKGRPIPVSGDRGTFIRRAGLNQRRQVSLLCGPVPEGAGSPGWFSSSSLPPSFARERRTAVFFSAPWWPGADAPRA